MHIPLMLAIRNGRKSPHKLLQLKQLEAAARFLGLLLSFPSFSRAPRGTAACAPTHHNAPPSGKRLKRREQNKPSASTAGHTEVHQRTACCRHSATHKRRSARSHAALTAKRGGNDVINNLDGHQPARPRARARVEATQWPNFIFAVATTAS